ncbi:MAG: Asp-tRNA(Asn)/Glu-tRNA(Gln) amidotransferase subunit GatB [Candidatus Micrarchaeota archaeon]|nr:Asp-tRNA(Asn)/Glu-tRNA(Gln) amidotransferase subunit GatB [Candidatus Micrarchaeota archaeon]
MTKIGLEIHCQLNTRTKLFCADLTSSGNAKPNENTCPICLGFPGYKPKINKMAIDYTIMAALALECGIAERSLFSRKTYFYPDLSKNYQITQYEMPIAENGQLAIGEKKIRIRRVHLEEDPAQIAYVGGGITNAKYTLINYNRSGTPLIEIVTEPDFESPREARDFLEKLSSILEHIGIYEPTKEGSIRIDANVSTHGERVELKNITGFENVEKALNFEIVRQNGLARMQEEISRETRHFDANTNTTKKLRSKEYEEDYGYIFDPDLPMLKIDREWVSRISSTMPELPDIRIARFIKEYGIDEYTSKVMIYYDKNIADFFEKCCKMYQNPKTVANWISNYLMKSLNWRSERIKDSKVKPEMFVELLQMMESKEITERYAKELIKEYVDTGISPRELAKKNSIHINNDELRNIVVKAIEENRKAVEDFRKGNNDALQFLIGVVLSRTKKQGDPIVIKRLITEQLNG